MWRLLHGEGPAELNAKVLVLMIGTNDLHVGAPEANTYSCDALKPSLGDGSAQGVATDAENWYGLIPECVIISVRAKEAH